MRLEDYLTQNVMSRRAAGKPKAAPAAFSSQAGEGDSVTISAEAKALGFSAAAPDENAVRSAFKLYMDKLLGRGQAGGAKTPAEKMKELLEKIRQLKTRLSEIADDHKLSEPTRASLTKTLTAQIEGLEAQVSELGKEIAAAAAET